MSIERRLFDSLAAKKGRATLTSLLSSFGEEERSLAEIKAVTLVRSGRLALKREGDDFMVTVGKTRVEPAHEEAEPAQAQKDVSVVVSVPISRQQELRTGFPTVTPTDEVFERLLARTKRSLKLSIPFPDEAVIAHFSGALRTLALRRVRLRILSRELLDGVRSDFNYLSLAKCFARVFDIYEGAGAEDLLEVRDYHESIFRSGSRLHYESTHAKIFISDGVACYVGSAELRLNALYNNFEMGLFLRGNLVRQVEGVFDLIWSHARPVGRGALPKISGSG